VHGRFYPLVDTMRQAANKPASRRKSKPAPAYIPPVALSVSLGASKPATDGRFKTSQVKWGFPSFPEPFLAPSRAPE
jgi:hypothetical protein